MVSNSTIERNKVTVSKLFEEVINTGRLDLCARFAPPELSCAELVRLAQLFRRERASFGMTSA